MNGQRRSLMPAKTVIETLEQSEADLAAGRWESFDDFLARIDKRIAEWTGNIEPENAEPPADL